MADTLTFDNPTELKLSHDSKRANNVIFIPTPTSDSNLTKIMSNEDVYYTKGADTCNYRKVVTPKSSISGRNIDCNNESVKVYHITQSGGTEVNNGYYIDDGDARELNFSVDGFDYGANVINEDEISFNDGTNNIRLENFSNVSHTIEDGATHNTFSFSVPSNVSKVEINHNTDKTNDQNKAKIIFDLDNSDSSKQLLYVNEKIGTDSLDIVTNVDVSSKTKNIVSYKVLQSSEVMNTQKAVYFIEFGDNNIFFASQKLPSYIYRLLVDEDLGDETNKHVYTFLGLDDDNNFVLKYYNFSQTLKITDSNGKEVNLYNKLMTIEELNTSLTDYGDYTEGITPSEIKVSDDVVIVPITFKYDASVGKIVFYPYGTFADSNNKAKTPGLLSYCNEVLSACLLKTSLDDAVSSGKQFIKNTNYIVNGTTTGNPNVISIFVGTETYSYSGATYNDSLIGTGKLNFSKLCEKILS